MFLAGNGHSRQSGCVSNTEATMGLCPPREKRETPMSQLSRSATINAPLNQVWQTIADVGSIANWHPGVENSPVLSESATGLGAKRRVELYDGSSAVEEVTALEEGRFATLTMSEFDMPLKEGAVTFRVDAEGGKTQVTMTLDYEMKYGPAGWLMNAVMLRPILGGLFAKVLAGLDHHIATGEVIGKDWKPS